MRGILFKAKRVDNSEWETGSLVRMRVDCSDEQVFIADKMTGYLTPVAPSTVCQYTGLTDKNGVKIWEGDICKDSLGWVFTVLWDEENGRFIGRHSKPRGDTYICYVGKIPAVEIIGSIHDTPKENNK